MEFQKAMQQLNKQGSAPVVTLFGTEYVLQQEFLHTLLKSFGEADTLDLTRIDLDEQSMDAVLDEAEMFSFFAEYRLVIAENATFLTGQTKQKLTDAQQKRLEAYLEQPNPMSVVIFLMPVDALDQRKKLTKRFQQQTFFVEVTALGEKEVRHYVQTFLENSALEMTRDAVQELLVRVQYQLSDALNEIAKLNNFGKPITLEVIRTLVPRTLENDVFELTKAVLNGRIQEATQIYRDLLLMKHEPIALHALLVSQFRLFIQVKLLAEKGFMEGDIAKQLGVHPYRVKLAGQEIRRYSLKLLAQFYEKLIETDVQLKTGVGVRETHFDLLLIQLALLQAKGGRV
ncbi:MAG: DNA polymerase III subunit delta [Aerococcaceae bacterium]|nr:DNA polymerase III subunit delta [Aerococcaceae bacterium]